MAGVDNIYDNQVKNMTSTSSVEELGNDRKQGYASKQSNGEHHCDQEVLKPKTMDMDKKECDEINLTELANMRPKSYAKPVIPYQTFRTSYGRNMYAPLKIKSEETSFKKVVEKELRGTDTDLIMQKHRDTPNRKRVDLNTKLNKKVKNTPTDEPDPENFTEIANRMRLKSYAKPVIPLCSYSSPVSDRKALYDQWKIKNDEEQVKILAEELVRKHPVSPIVGEGEVSDAIKEKFLNIQTIIKKAEDEAKNQEEKCRQAENQMTSPVKQLETTSPQVKESISPKWKQSLEDLVEDPQSMLQDAYNKFLSVAVTCKVENVPSFEEWCGKLSSSSSQIKQELFSVDICSELAQDNEGGAKKLQQTATQSVSVSSCPEPVSALLDRFTSTKEYQERRRQRRDEFDKLFNQISFVAKSSLPAVWRKVSLLNMESSGKK